MVNNLQRVIKTIPVKHVFFDGGQFVQIGKTTRKIMVPFLYCKKALGILKYKLQIAKKKNSLIVSSSTALYQEELHQIMKQ